jgi:hypothetical protein
MFRNRRRGPARDLVPWLAIGQRMTRRQAKKREAEACDRPAQPEQERQMQSHSPGELSVELFPDPLPLPRGDSETAQLGGPAGQPGAQQTPPLPEDADADRGGPGALDDVRREAVARMRFREKPDPAASAVRARLLVELQIASGPADEGGSVDAALRMSRETPSADGLGERFEDAIAEYVADTFDNQARILFETPDFLGPEEAGAVLDRCQQELVDLVKALVEQRATAGGAPSLAAALAGGIGADFVLAPEISREESVSAIIDICVIGIGYATAQPHLVAVAVKHLSRTVFHEAVQRGAYEILKDLRKPAAPSATVPAPHVITLPAEIEPDLGQSASSGPGGEPNPSSPGF